MKRPDLAFACGYREVDPSGASPTGEIVCGAPLHLPPTHDSTHLLTCPRCGLPYEVAVRTVARPTSRLHQSLLTDPPNLPDYREIELLTLGDAGRERITFGTPGTDLMMRPGDDLLLVWGLASSAPTPDLSMDTLGLVEGPWERLTKEHRGYRPGAQLAVLLVKNLTTRHEMQAASFWKETNPAKLTLQAATAPAPLAGVGA